MRRIAIFTIVLGTLIAAAPAHADVVAPPTPAPAPKAPATTTAPPFEYAPFPDIPIDTVQENPFAGRLVIACNALDGAPPPDTTAMSRAPIDPNRRQDLTKVQAGDASEVAETTHIVSELRNACHQLLSSPPLELTSEELAALRLVLAQPAVLDLARSWALDNFQKGKLGVAAKSGSQQSSAVATIAPVGALTDSLIRGMAEFIQKRAQQEALLYLRKQLKNDLCHGEQAALFSNVCEALENLEDARSLQAIGSYLRAAAEKDLQKLPDVALAYAAYRDSTLMPVAFSGQLAFAYFKAVKGGRAPLEVLWSIGSLPAQSCETAACAAVASSIRLASAVGYALRQEGADWQNALPTPDSKTMPVYAVAVALLAEARLITKNDKFPRFSSAQLKRFMATPAAILVSGRALAAKWKELLASVKNDKLTVDQRRELLLGAIGESVSGVSELMQFVEPLRTGELDHTVRDCERRFAVLAKIALTLSERRYADGAVELVKELRDSKVASRLPGKWSTLLPFLVELASAQSSNEVAATFDAYAAPLATYELKYRKRMLAVNGFLGGFAGWEHTGSHGLNGNAGAAAIFAPVGLHATFPVIVDYLHLGVALSILDLGAITTVRGDAEPKGKLDTATDSTQPVEAQTSPQIGFEQVFSPGAYFTVAPFKLSPIVAGFGLSMSPKLRHVTQGEVSEDVSVLRYGFFISADVPILPLN